MYLALLWFFVHSGGVLISILIHLYKLLMKAHKPHLIAKIRGIDSEWLLRFIA